MLRNGASGWLDRTVMKLVHSVVLYTLCQDSCSISNWLCPLAQVSDVRRCPCPGFWDSSARQCMRVRVSGCVGSGGLWSQQSAKSSVRVSVMARICATPIDTPRKRRTCSCFVPRMKLYILGPQPWKLNRNGNFELQLLKISVLHYM